MQQISIENSFESWRNAARELLLAQVSPDAVIWNSNTQGGLFDLGASQKVTPAASIRVSPDLLRMARAVACFDDAAKWALLYRLLFRHVNECRDLLSIDSDADVRRARLMEKAVSRDIHKFHAFVRFRRIDCDGDEIYAAWHEPQHFTVERAAPFFRRRFGSMKFSIFTPKGCAHWDKETLTFSPPVDRSAAPGADEMEDLWLLYYRSIFNPFRLKVNAMKKEFPVRHWPTLPEAVLISELIRGACE